MINLLLRNKISGLLELLNGHQTYPGSGRVEVDNEVAGLATKLGLQTRFVPATCGDGIDPGKPDRWYIVLPEGE